jgi:hypothetical protein
MFNDGSKNFINSEDFVRIMYAFILDNSPHKDERRKMYM